jgi:hypothetical protein
VHRLYLAVLGFWQRSGGRPLAGQPKVRPSDLYVIASDDRGETWEHAGARFLRMVRITPEPSCPSVFVRQQGLATWYAFGGDYNGLAAGADGRFHVLWAGIRSCVYQLMAATARVVP